jgi:DNA polymerase alpha-associated DNA helicase A
MDKALHQLEKAMIPPTSSSSTSPSSQSPHAPSQLARVLLGLCPPSEPFPSPTPLTFFDLNLNDSQRAAVKFALDAQEVACIHGPPGTGKTWTLVEIVRQLVNRGNRNDDSIADRPRKILICGASNLSVDNILERLLALPEKLNVTRVGHPARVMTGGVEGAKILDATLEVRASRSDQASLFCIPFPCFLPCGTNMNTIRLLWPRISKLNWKLLWVCFPEKERGRRGKVFEEPRGGRCGKRSRR